MHRLCQVASRALAAAAILPSIVLAQGAKLNKYGNPARVAPAPTTAAITARDLQIRLYQFADDSMQGRQVGRIGNYKGTAMIAAEVKRLGLMPAGDNGTYFQVLPFHTKRFTDHSRLTVDGNPLEWNDEWVAVPGTRAPRGIDTAQVIFGGVEGDTTQQISAAQAAGKFVVVLPDPNAGARGRGGRGGRGGGRGGFGAAPSRFSTAVAVAVVNLDSSSAAARATINIPTVATQSAPPAAGGRGGGRGGRGAPAGPPPDTVTVLNQLLGQMLPQANIRLTRAAAAKLFGRPLDRVPLGATGGKATASLDFVELPSDWARNVVAVIPGSDPVLKHEYVAIGAHNDHIGMTPGAAVDHDSLKAFNDARNKMLIANDMIGLTADQLRAIHINMDSIRKIYPKPRLDSINNGADDDGSGSMGVLEIAESMQSMRVKPKRSILFVWHTGEESGLQGSRFFTHNPTVPMDSIVAQINIDMIGRGRAEDLPGGGPDYLGVVGSYFDSKDLGETVAAVNRKQSKPMQLDYRYDTTLTWTGYNNIYGRSDHFNYALQGVPIAFFFTGLHGDYHQRTDEPEFIDYPHYARIANYIHDIMIEVANGPRPRLNGTKPARPRTVTP
ncbi:MAG: M28 family peptidase [Gemmatimonadaceae bacterium]